VYDDVDPTAEECVLQGSDEGSGARERVQRHARVIAFGTNHDGLERPDFGADHVRDQP